MVATWTVDGAPANGSDCAPFSSLLLDFIDPLAEDDFGYEPVACDEGKFSVDKMPMRFVEATLGETDSNTPGDTESIDGSGNVSFDLQ